MERDIKKERVGGGGRERRGIGKRKGGVKSGFEGEELPSRLRRVWRSGNRIIPGNYETARSATGQPL